MPESPSNIDPKEAIEAKLCAYLENELTPPERAEIETYLESNPQHRQLLGELAKTRLLLQSLPRESAPMEIAESFQGHVERSMLLDGTSDDKPLARISRWPQIALAAAILLFAAGLGVVIYMELPGNTTAQKFTAATPSATPSAPAGASQFAATEPFGVAAPSKTTELADRKPVNGFGGGGGSFANEASNAPSQLQQAAAPTSVAGGMLVNTPVVQTSLGTSNRQAYLVVRSDDPAAASNQVKDYFTTNGILYQAVPPRAQGYKLDVNGGALATKTDSEGLVGNGTILSTTQPALGEALAMDSVRQQAQQSPQPPISIDQTSQVLQRDREFAVATTAPSDELLNSDAGTFVIHGISQREVDKFSQALSNQQARQSTEFYWKQNAEGNSLASTQPATTQPGDQIIQKDDRLTINVPQLVGPGVDQTNTVSVAKDGTITLPMIEPIPAAGEATEELKKEIADKYRRANLIPEAQVSITRAPATTEPAATQAVAAAGATTMPAEVPATQPAADKVDVVVVIQKNLMPATEPTTLPTTLPTAQ